MVKWASDNEHWSSLKFWWMMWWNELMIIVLLGLYGATLNNIFKCYSMLICVLYNDKYLNIKMLISNMIWNIIFCISLETSTCNTTHTVRTRLQEISCFSLGIHSLLPTGLFLFFERRQGLQNKNHIDAMLEMFGIRI